MGNSQSALSTNMLVSLKKFNILNKLPSDCSKADYIISVEATNVLKHVNSNDLLRLGGHKKRKHTPIKNGISAKFTTPIRRSRCVTMNPD